MSPETYYSVEEGADLFRKAWLEAKTDSAFGGEGVPTPETSAAFVEKIAAIILHTCADAQRESDNAG